MSVSNITDEVLWKSLKEGYEWAFSALFERYYSTLINYGKSLHTSTEQVRDCVQDVFADVWLYRHTLGDATSIKAYLLASLRKRIARQYERDRVFRHTAPLEEVHFLLDFTIEDRLIHQEAVASNVRQLNTLINALPVRQKEALYLRYHQGVNVEQIAEIMNINYQSVVNLLYKAIQQLRSCWVGEVSLLLYLFRFI